MLLTNELSNRLTFAICAAAALMVLLTLLYAIITWRNDWALAHQQLPTLAPQAANESRGLETNIPALHLFGQNLSSTGKVPLSNLQLQLSGTVTVAKEKPGVASKAYISIAGQAAKIYRVGESLANGVKVYEISSNAVILENNGRLEKLPLPRPPLEFKAKKSEERL